ncbi:phytanoyl-CoA dioxygenase family protein [Tsukamurella sp. 1534]|uniref:phytanoyl-CoA dioxygenase family protein n=1 Tax=Tsukamurella sp. 1534 TaxID=1151061 RepID=UPI0002DC71AD|nr:phytanoyl-CoA dioxygenase family protein [Tsukamurella sp. 1534]
MPMDDELTDDDVEAFVRDGFVALRGAFDAGTAAAGRDVLWEELERSGVRRDDPSTWERPVVRLGDHGEEPFRAAARAPAVVSAADRLVGAGRWLRRVSLGTFPVRFPSDEDPVDDGWHVDAGFPGEDPTNFLRWRVNFRSDGRALLLLYLFSDTGPGDAPTRIRVGSHRRIAASLRRYGDEGVEVFGMTGEYAETDGLPEVLATGEAGDVFVCHPFLVHAAQAMRPAAGRAPRFLAQPPLLPTGRIELGRPVAELSPVARAIVEGAGA